jgi:hypothetical protein
MLGPVDMWVVSNLGNRSTLRKIDPQRTLVPKLQLEVQQILKP